MTRIFAPSGDDGPRAEGRAAADAGGLHRRGLPAAVHDALRVLPLDPAPPRRLPRQQGKVGGPRREGQSVGHSAGG